MEIFPPVPWPDVVENTPLVTMPNGATPLKVPSLSNPDIVTELVGVVVAEMVMFPPSPAPVVLLTICAPLLRLTVCVLVIEMLPPGLSPVVVLWMEAPSIWKFPAMICMSAPGSAPEFDVTIELPRLNEIVSCGPTLSAVVSTASFTLRTNCPPLIETVFVPLTLMFEPGAREKDPKEVNNAPSTFVSA